MNRPINRALGVAVLLATTLGGCASQTPVVPTPTGELITETFTGTVATAGTSTHSFSAMMAGAVTATLNSLSPDSTIAIGMTLGTWSYQACSMVVTDNSAKVNSVIVGKATSAVTLCLSVYDVGNVSAETSYSVTVTHY